MGEKIIALFFVGIFSLVQFMGLFIGSQYIGLIKSGQVEPVFGNPQNIGNSIFLMLYILAGAGVMILAIKFWKFFIRILEAVAIFFASVLTFMFLVPIDILFVPVGILLAFALTAWKMLKPSIINQNLALIFSTASVGAILGASLGILPSLLFLILLAIYDFISVFVTKHMVYMAKEIVKTPTAFTLAFPYKFKKPVQFAVGKKKIRKMFHVFQLGGGDIAIPLMFTVSVFSVYGIQHALLTMIFSVIALGSLIYFVSKRPGRALPAIPFIAVGTVLGFLLSVLMF